MLASRMVDLLLSEIARGGDFELVRAADDQPITFVQMIDERGALVDELAVRSRHKRVRLAKHAGEMRTR